MSAIRVQIPAYTDAWIKGDRFGDIVKIGFTKVPRLPDGFHKVEVAQVKLDKSGKTIRVILDDCTIT